MNTARRLKKRLLPVHWRIASKLPLRARRQYLYIAGTKRTGDFSSPKTFNEKVNWRILHDHDSRIVEACDKVRMKERAGELAPKGLRIPQTWWFGTDLREVPAALWDRPWVLKPNHGSGKVCFGPMELETVLFRTNGWLDEDPGSLLGEWGYTRARRVLLMEERIPSEDLAPTDYKFYTFAGVPRVIQVNTDRFDDTHVETYYDPDWQRLPLSIGGLPCGAEPRPVHLEEMLHYARILAVGWDFIRVDFYDVGDDVWFGEFSPYPNGGVGRIRPAGWDERMGSWWPSPVDEAAAVERWVVH